MSEIQKVTSAKTAQKKAPLASPSASRRAMLPDHQLVAFENRITYTFAHEKEVGSIHFDRGRQEIFFKGHNIRNMDVETWQWQVLEKFRKLLSADSKWKEYAESYAKTLDKIVLEKKKV